MYTCECGSVFKPSYLKRHCATKKHKKFVDSMNVVPEECSICQEEIKKKKKLECNHSFCETCINRWLLSHNTCPCCRATVSHSQRPLSVRLVLGAPSQITFIISEAMLQLNLNEAETRHMLAFVSALNALE